jgi:O-antigen/teichoic acid export membrane protein
LTKAAPYAGFILLGTLSIVFRDQADKIILSSVASPAWAGYYGIAARLAGIVAIVCTFLYIPTIAVSGALFANNDWPGIRGIYDDVITMMSYLAGLIVVIIAGLHDRIVYLWFGKLIPEVGGILYLLLIGIGTAVILTGAGSSVCRGIGKVRVETLYIIVGLILNILMKIVLVPIIGAIGTVISSAVSWALASVIFILFLHKFTELPPAASMKAVKTMIIVVACVLFARAIAFVFPVEAKRTMVGLSAMIMTILIILMFTIMMVLSKVITKEKILHFPQIIKRTIGGKSLLI